MNHFWCDQYEPGVSATIDTAPFSSMLASFANYTSRFSDYAAFSNFGVKLTYAELNEGARRVAAYLQQQLDVVKGDRVAVMMPNLLQYPLSVFGILHAGGVVVNVNPLYTARELRHTLQDSGAKVIVICANFAHTLQEVIADTQVEHVIVTGIGDRLGAKGAVMNFVLKYIKRMVKPYRFSAQTSFNAMLSSYPADSYRPVDVGLSDLAFLQYTGGTTGPSKGAMLTHGNMVANATQLRTWVKSITVAGKDVVVTPLPLYHIFSLTVCCLAFIGLGVECQLITNPRDLTGFIGLLKKYPGTIMVGINTLYNALAEHPNIHQVDFSQLKFSSSGGMATQSAVNDKWFELTKTHIIEGYGLTETSPVVSLNPMTETQFTGSAGLPLPSTEVSVRDESGEPLAVSEVGEVWVRGPQVMQGYWNKPEETQQVITEDGWFKTGDIGRLEENGRLYIVDRKKDMVIVSGFNVYPNEIEDVLVEHEGISEAAVIGVKSEVTGEAVKAFIVKSDPGLTEQDIINYCRKQLTAYKIPKQIAFCDTLPKSNVGKVLRRELRPDAVSVS